jgi:tetratricopeptide (TPR) repeat protein
MDDVGSDSVLILRLRQAEYAMADGRLDEAFEIVQSPAIRQHRRGQKLTGKLARAFVKRGQENLSAARIQQALTDCNKAEKLAGNLPQAVALRTAICKAIEEKRYRDQQDALKIAQVQNDIENGRLSAAEKILTDGSDGNGKAGTLKQKAALARLEIDQAIEKAQQALQRDDIEAAIDILLARSGGPVVNTMSNHNSKLSELLSRIRGIAANQIRENLNHGRLDLAQALHQRVAPIADGCSGISELGLALAHCRRAAESVAQGRPREASRLLRQVKAICPSAKWLDPATRQTEQAAAFLDELSAGPLGLNTLEGSGGDKRADIGATENGRLADSDSAGRNRLRRRAASNHQDESTFASEFVLQIDGIGSFLVLREPRVTVGPVSSSARPTVGLIADPYLPTLVFERSDGDYFVRCSDTFQVNNKPTTEKLLNNGDRIALSPRCGMKFNLPNPASTTAVVTLSSARINRADVRQIILMERDILLGPSLSAHIPIESLSKQAALFIQNGRLLCRTEDAVTVDGRVLNSQTGLPMNKQIKIGPISMVLTEWKE